MQLWPANENALAAQRAAASSRSASGSTITGVAFPSSRLTRLRGARSRSFHPTPAEPVKVISFTRSSSTSTSPISAAGPTRTLSQPAGSPASCSSSASRSAESGVCEAGFRTTAQPAARAGAILCATRLSGKLNGLIAPTTPIGMRRVKASLPSPAWEASIGTISPASFRASTAAMVYVDIARATSTRAALSGLPGLGGDLPGDLVGAPPECPGDAYEDLGPLVRGQRVPHRTLGCVDGRARLRRACLRDTRDERAVVRRGDVHPVTRLDPFSVEEQLSLGGDGRHGASLRSGTVSAMTDALIVDAVRSPIGRRNGALSGVRAEELAAQVLNGLVSRLDVDPGEVEDVQMGCVSQVGEQALNIARMSSLVAGWPETVCGSTIDRQCGSSMQAAFNAAAAIQAGHLDVVVASGVESMSRVPMGSNLTVNGFEGFSPKLYEHWEVVPQGISAEVIADEWELSREELDEYSYESHRRAIAAIDEGRFEREIVPVEVGAGGAAVLVAVDENPRRDTSLEKLAALKPAFKEDGKITAGNSSAIVDGAAAMLVTSEAAVGGSGSSLARDSSPSVSRASTRTGCSTATQSRASVRSRRPA